MLGRGSGWGGGQCGCERRIEVFPGGSVGEGSGGGWVGLVGGSGWM